MEYLLHLLILSGIYGMVALSLNLTSGYTRLISLAHASFFGIGAYVSALLSLNAGWPFLLSLPVAMAICGLLAMTIGLAALRTVDDHFILCTLGMQFVISALLSNWTSVTRGTLGLAGIPSLDVFGWPVGSKAAFLLFELVLLFLLFWFIRRIVHSGYGLALKAISEDELYVQSLGYDVRRLKLSSFAIGAALAAIPGALFAHYASYIDPGTFTINESILVLSMVIIGGLGNLRGGLLAAVILIILPEILRFMGFPSSASANLRQIAYGFGLVVISLAVARKQARTFVIS